MEIGALLIVITLVFYTQYIINLLRPDKREEIRYKNQEIERLRKIPIKSMEEQKEFLELRYPKSKFKFTLDFCIYALVYLVFLVILFKSYTYLVTQIPYEIKWWYGLLFLIFFPLIVNKILSKFGLQKAGVKIF